MLLSTNSNYPLNPLNKGYSGPTLPKPKQERHPRQQKIVPLTVQERLEATPRKIYMAINWSRVFTFKPQLNTSDCCGCCCCAKSLQACPTLCDPIGGSLWGSPVPGILQARTLQWVAISFSSAWKWKVKVKSLSRVWLFATPWTAAYRAPPSMGFSRQECWSGVPLPSPDFHLHPNINSVEKKGK